MMERLDVKILGGGQNWVTIGGRIAVGLSGYYSPLPEGSTVSTVTMNPAQSVYDGPLRVADRTYDMAITTPGWFARLAAKGLAPYDKALPLRALAAFPHDDRMAFAVKRSLGIKSLREIRDRKIPLKISTAPPGSWHPAYWGASVVLAEYGFSFEDMVSWGGELLADRPRYINHPDSKAVSDDFDAVFDEAVMTRRWHRITEDHDMVFLPVDEDVMQRLEAKGWNRGLIKKGQFRGVEEDLLAADFSDWLLFCHEDMDEELAYLTIGAIEEQAKTIEGLFPPPFTALTGPVDLRRLATHVPIPLHAGAERYYREKGALD
jgi:TRAP-type uncharacterized transport system substrate-binding protein